MNKGLEIVGITETPTKSLIPLEKFFAQYKEGKFNFQYLEQRNYVWNIELKTNLIYALFAGVTIDPIEVNEYIENNNYTWGVMSGGNRCRTIASYLNNELKLPNDIPIIKILDNNREKNILDISNKYFIDLPINIQNFFKTKILDFNIYKNLTSEQVNAIMYVKNQSKALSKIEELKMLNYGSEINNFINAISNSLFLKYKVYLTLPERKKKTEEKIAYQILILETLGLEYGFLINNKIINSLQNIDFSDKEKEIKQTIEYLSNSFPEKLKIVNYKNIIKIYYLAKKAIKDNIEPLKFGGLIQQIQNNNILKKQQQKTAFTSEVVKTDIKILEQYYKENIQNVQPFKV